MAQGVWHELHRGLYAGQRDQLPLHRRVALLRFATLYRRVLFLPADACTGGDHLFPALGTLPEADILESLMNLYI